jgi:hypothetical protein
MPEKEIKWLVSGKGIINIVYDGEVVVVDPSFKKYNEVIIALGSRDPEELKKALSLEVIPEPGQKYHFLDKESKHCYASFIEDGPDMCEICLDYDECFGDEDDEEEESEGDIPGWLPE